MVLGDTRNKSKGGRRLVGGKSAGKGKMIEKYKSVQ